LRSYLWEARISTAARGAYIGHNIYVRFAG
jgi:hypothetical protein